MCFMAYAGERVRRERRIKCWGIHNGHHLRPATHSHKAVPGVEAQSEQCAGGVSSTERAGQGQATQRYFAGGLMRGLNWGE